MEYTYNDNIITFNIEEIEYNCNSHIPNCDIEETECEMLFLCSPYYSSENDYINVSLDEGKSKRIGWIIPINLLCNIDDSYLESLDNHLMKFADVAQRKLLSYCHKMNLLTQATFDITDLVPDTCILFVYRKESLTDDNANYITPSLYNSGFYTVKDPLIINHDRLYKSDLMNLEISDKKIDGKSHKIKLKIKNKKYNQLFFVNRLYSDILVNNSNPFIRYISLYQIIEFLMKYAFDEMYFTAIMSYEQEICSKNDLREKLNKISNEKTLINKMFEGINMNNTHYVNFNDKVKNLFNLIGKSTQDYSTFVEYMYALRNTIVHEMRNLINEEYNIFMVEIVEVYEKLIFILLQECKLKLNDKKELFVVNKDYSYKVNKRKMKKIHYS